MVARKHGDLGAAQLRQEAALLLRQAFTINVASVRKRLLQQSFELIRQAHVAAHLAAHLAVADSSVAPAKGEGIGERVAGGALPTAAGGSPFSRGSAALLPSAPAGY